MLGTDKKIKRIGNKQVELEGRDEKDYGKKGTYVKDQDSINDREGGEIGRKKIKKVHNFTLGISFLNLDRRQHHGMFPT